MLWLKFTWLKLDSPCKTHRIFVNSIASSVARSGRSVVLLPRIPRIAFVKLAIIIVIYHFTIFFLSCCTQSDIWYVFLWSMLHIELIGSAAFSVQVFVTFFDAVFFCWHPWVFKLISKFGVNLLKSINGFSCYNYGALE